MTIMMYYWSLLPAVVTGLMYTIGIGALETEINSSKAVNLARAAGSGDLQTVSRLINEGVNVNSRIVGGLTALMKASAHGHLNVIQLLVEKGANINEIDRNGYSALLWAVDKHISDLNTIKYLVEHQADINIKSRENGYTVLHWVIRHGDLDMVKYLVEKGARINEKTKEGEAPVHLAAAYNHIHVLKYFIDERGVKFDIFNAAEKGYTSAVQYFIEGKGVDVNTKDNEGNTPLMHAVNFNKSSMVHYLLELKNADVHDDNYRKQTSLHLAVHHGFLDIVKYLVDRNADMKAKDSDGQTPVFYAATTPSKDRLSILQYFVEEKGASVYLKDNNGRSMLHGTVFPDALDIAKYLVEQKGVDINEQDIYGYTPIMYATDRARHGLFFYLLNLKNVDLNIGNNKQETCLHWAAIHGFGFVGDLSARGANINAKNSDGQTPLYYAARGVDRGHLNEVRHLVEKGADVRQKDNYGNTLLHAMQCSGPLEVIKYLVEEKKLDVNAKNDAGIIPFARCTEAQNAEIVNYMKAKGQRRT